MVPVDHRVERAEHRLDGDARFTGVEIAFVDAFAEHLQKDLLVAAAPVLQLHKTLALGLGGADPQVHLYPFHHGALVVLGLDQGFHVTAGHAVQPRLGGRRAPHFRVHRLHQGVHGALVDLEEQVRFGIEIVIHHAFGGAQAARDIVNAGGLEALLHKAARRGVQDGIPGAVLQVGGRGCHGRCRGERHEIILTHFRESTIVPLISQWAIDPFHRCAGH